MGGEEGNKLGEDADCVEKKERNHVYWNMEESKTEQRK